MVVRTPKCGMVARHAWSAGCAVDVGSGGRPARSLRTMPRSTTACSSLVPSSRHWLQAAAVSAGDRRVPGCRLIPRYTISSSPRRPRTRSCGATTNMSENDLAVEASRAVESGEGFGVSHPWRSRWSIKGCRHQIAQCSMTLARARRGGRCRRGLFQPSPTTEAHVGITGGQWSALFSSAVPCSTAARWWSAPSAAARGRRGRRGPHPRGAGRRREPVILPPGQSRSRTRWKSQPGIPA